MRSTADLIIYVGGITPATGRRRIRPRVIELPDVQEELMQAAPGDRQADGHGQLQRFRRCA